MKLSGAQAVRFFAKPEPGIAGLLIYGGDAMRVALRRQEVIAALVGPEGEAEMRLTRLAGAALKSDPAGVGDGLKAQGFFPGPRVVFVDMVTEAQAPPVLAALEDWEDGDASLIVTSGSLRATSKLRKAFEGHRRAFAVGLYDDPPGREEIEAALASAGLKNISGEARRDIETLARSLDPGDFRQTVEKLGLYMRGEDAPVSPEDVANCAPATIEAAVDDVLHAAAEGRAGDIGPLMQKLNGQGVGPVTLCIGAMRHFRTLHAACCDPGGPSSGMGRVRPPVFGPRRDRMVRQASRWGTPRLETALSVLTDTDLTLRSSSMAPQMAVVERALIRLSMLAGR